MYKRQQEDLALSAGVSQGQLTAFETGKKATRVQSWKLLANALNMPISELITDPAIEIVPAITQN